MIFLFYDTSTFSELQGWACDLSRKKWQRGRKDCNTHHNTKVCQRREQSMMSCPIARMYFQRRRGILRKEIPKFCFLSCNHNDTPARLSQRPLLSPSTFSRILREPTWRKGYIFTHQLPPCPLRLLIDTQISPYHPPQGPEESGYPPQRLLRRSQCIPAGAASRGITRTATTAGTGRIRRPRRLLVQFVDLSIDMLESLLLILSYVSIGPDREALEGFRFRESLDEYFVGHPIGYPLNELVHCSK